MKKVDGDNEGIYDGFVRIIWGDRARTFCVTANGDEKDDLVTLNSCLKIIEYNGRGVVIVILEDATYGKVYKYERGCGWKEHGNTYGFA